VVSVVGGDGCGVVADAFDIVVVSVLVEVGCYCLCWCGRCVGLALVVVLLWGLWLRCLVLSLSLLFVVGVALIGAVAYVATAGVAVVVALLIL
jgi:hypothetical protein